MTTILFFENLLNITNANIKMEKWLYPLYDSLSDNYKEAIFSAELRQKAI